MKDTPQKSPKNWWAPVWKGLVADQEAKHYRGMKNALWLFLYLVLHADRRSGKLKRKCRTISQDMGINSKTIHRWLKVLRDKKYVKTRNTGRCLEIEISKWRPLAEWSDDGILNTQNGAHRVSKNGDSQEPLKSENSFNPSPQMEIAPHPNDITIKKDLLNNDIDNKYFMESDFKDFKPKNKRERLALDLAEALDDLKGLALYLSYSKKYPEYLLRKVLGEVMEIPPEKIKKSRGALFNHLVKIYGQETI